MILIYTDVSSDDYFHRFDGFYLRNTFAGALIMAM